MPYTILKYQVAFKASASARSRLPGIRCIVNTWRKPTTGQEPRRIPDAPCKLQPADLGEACNLELAANCRNSKTETSKEDQETDFISFKTILSAYPLVKILLSVSISAYQSALLRLAFSYCGVFVL
jgi:hypothetical protein